VDEQRTAFERDTDEIAPKEPASNEIPRCHAYRLGCKNPAAYHFRGGRFCLSCFRAYANYSPSMRDVLWVERAERLAAWRDKVINLYPDLEDIEY
jgi:hypothetical protein